MNRHRFISDYNKPELCPDLVAGQIWERNSLPIDGLWTDEIVIMSDPKFCENYNEPSVFALAIPEKSIDSWKFWCSVSVIQKYYNIKRNL